MVMIWAELGGITGDKMKDILLMMLAKFGDIFGGNM